MWLIHSAEIIGKSGLPLPAQNGKNALTFRGKLPEIDIQPVADG